ncbi:MAG: LD-carboxypeptidase [Deltaproteobacteria bacterium]|nr:LD-carboxypeptidase [Deltaproteobacteria bacterium]
MKIDERYGEVGMQKCQLIFDRVLRPARLKPGDEIGIAAPASHFDMENYNHGVHVLESMGFCLSVLDDMFDRNRYLAGSDVHRANLLNKLFADSSIKAIVCARGGYGSIRILPLLDYNIIRNNPKIFVGFSDVSAILSAIYTKCGLVTFHGPMVTTLSNASQKTKKSMMATFLSDTKLEITIEKSIVLRHGSASGIVSGGNLATLCHLAGTPFQPSFKDHILFLEDRGEAAYKIDRMLTQMKMAGYFEGIAGLVLGFFEDCGKIKEVFSVIDNIFKDDDIPILSGLEAGHGRNNITIPFGITATLDSDSNLLSFHEVATS